MSDEDSDLLLQESSAGGARPKLTVEDAGALWLAKGPSIKDSAATLGHSLFGLAIGVTPVATGATEVPWRSQFLGEPGYARLDRHADGGIATGASDGGEIGAFGSDRDFQRASLLHEAITDVLPAGQLYTLSWR